LSEPQPGGQARPRHLLTLAAATDDDLKRRAADLAGAAAGLGAAELCAKAAQGDRRGEQRLAVSGPGAPELVAGLTAFVAGQKATGVVVGRATAPRPRLCFLCTGQGSQYAGMGRELYDTEPVYRDAVDACARALASELEVPLVDVMLGKGPDPALIDQTLYTQPSLFALETGLARLLASWGVEADVVLGHSVGEYVAATLAGVMSLEDGVRLLARRARLMQALPAGGKMSALTLSPDEAAKVVAPYSREVSLAAANGDEVSVIAGVGERITAIGAELEARGVTVTPLTVTPSTRRSWTRCSTSSSASLAPSVCRRPGARSSPTSAASSRAPRCARRRTGGATCASR